jgi:dihydroxyacetone kinase-like protein
MKEILTREDVKRALRAASWALIENAEELNALDAATGDGDMGVSARIGASAILKELDSIEAEELGIGEITRRAGLAFNRAAGSTIGALVATAAMRAAVMFEAVQEVDLAVVAGAAEAAAEGIAERGGAKLGDKTLLDSLVPAADALTVAAGNGALFSDAVNEALLAAEQGFLGTTHLEAQVGRGRWAGARGLDHPDAGAGAVVTVLRALAAEGAKSSKL